MWLFAAATSAFIFVWLLLHWGGGVGEWEVWGEKHEKEELRHRSVL